LDSVCIGVYCRRWPFGRERMARALTSARQLTAACFLGLHVFVAEITN